MATPPTSPEPFPIPIPGAHHGPAAEINWYCNVCNKDIDFQHIPRHLQEAAHGQNMKLSLLGEPYGGRKSLEGHQQPPASIPIGTTDLSYAAPGNLTRSQPDTRAPQSRVATWRCKICDVSMNPCNQAQHLGGAQHWSMLQKKILGHDPIFKGPHRYRANSAKPGRSKAGVYTSHIPRTDLRSQKTLQETIPSDEHPPKTTPETTPTTFHCRICDGDFPHAAIPFHRSSGWKCNICSSRMHIEWRQQHLVFHEAERAKHPTQSAYHVSTSDLTSEDTFPSNDPPHQLETHERQSPIETYPSHAISAAVPIPMSSNPPSALCLFAPSSIPGTCDIQVDRKPQKSTPNKGLFDIPLETPTFHCATCDTTCALSEKKKHRSSGWKCRCGRKMHHEDRVRHVEGCAIARF